jgi:SAM-dependent methyltransferase
VDVNGRYFVDYVLASGARRVLDYGCGHGELVAELRRRGVDCYGTEVFYEGGSYDSGELAALMDEGVIKHLREDEPVPFPNGTFDLIISNQVLEHVSDLPVVVAELDRLLADGGWMYHHFPSREVIREGHIGIPLAHRFPPGRARTLYTLALRTAGLGYHKGEPPREWTRRKLEWLDAYTHYRPFSEIRSAFSGYELVAREADYWRFRAQGQRIRVLLNGRDNLQSRVFRRLGFMALEMRRR